MTNWKLPVGADVREAGVVQHVGVAISGGGHRASLWGLGAMRYLVAARKAGELGAISSVSGGSITNGVLAQSIDDWDSLTAEEFDERTNPLVTNIVRDGLFHWGPATNGYLRMTLGVLTVGAAGLLAAIVWTAIAGLRWGAGALWLFALFALIVGFWLLTQRSRRTDSALAKVHFNDATGQPTLLRDLAARRVLHVLCATELQQGRHFYFSPRFLYTYGLGVGRVSDVKLSTAVQASACLPGAFAARRIPVDGHDFTAPDGPGGSLPLSDVVLVDGGVYDNMGEQWFASADHRARRLTELSGQAEVDELLVINASGLHGTRRLGRAFAPAREVRDLLACSGVMYAQTTSVRRVELAGLWDANRRLRRGQQGIIAQITQNPWSMARSVVDAATPNSSDEFQAMACRAEAVACVLGDARVDWQALVEANVGVATTLGRLTPAQAARLLFGSWAVVMTGAHIWLNYPLLPLPTVESLAGLVGEPLQPDVLPVLRKAA